MKPYRIDDKAVTALTGMMTDEEVAEEFEIADRSAKGFPVDEKLVLAVAAALQRGAKEGGIPMGQFRDHLLAEAAIIADDDPDYYRKVAAILRLERAS